MNKLLAPVEASQAEMDPRMREPQYNRPKYTRSAKALVWDQIKDLEAQTLHAEGTFEQRRQEKLVDNHFWLHGNR